jgi:site-specific recombinase XerD
MEPDENIEKIGANSDPVKQNGYSVTPGGNKRRRILKAPKYLTTEEITAFFKVITDLRDRALFRTIYHRGLRAHEPGRLRLSDFHARDGRLLVARGKGSTGGEYRLCDEELRSLRAYVRYVRGVSAGPLFLSRNGRALGRVQIWRLMQRYCKAAGIDPQKAHPHALKHSCGTHLAERGEDLLEIQDHMGHKNAANTRIYIDTTNKKRDARGDRLKDWK